MSKTTVSHMLESGNSYPCVVRVREKSLLARFHTYTDTDTDPERTYGWQSVHFLCVAFFTDTVTDTDTYTDHASRTHGWPAFNQILNKYISIHNFFTLYIYNIQYIKKV